MSEAKIKVSAQDDASRVLSDIRASMEQASRGAEALGTALGLVGIAGISGLVALAREAVNGVDALNDLKDATGASIENISALEDIAARTGTSFDTVSTSLVKFNAQLNEAKPGSAAEQALTALGLSVKELKALDPAEALLQTSLALNKFADDADKARVVQTLFGKSVKEVAPFLKDLADKGQLVATVTTQQAEAAARFNKELFNLQKNSTDAARAFALDLVTGINKAAQAFRDSGLIEGFRTLLTGDDRYKNNKQLVELTDQFVKAQNELTSAKAADAKFGDKSLRTAAAEKQLTILQQQLKTAQNYAKVLDDIDNPKGTEPPKPKVVVPDEPKKAGSTKVQRDSITDNQRALANYVNGLQAELTGLEKLSAEQRALNFLQTIGTEGEVAQVRELVLGRAKLIDSKRAEEEVSKRLAEIGKVNQGYLDGLAKEVLATEQSNQKLREQIEEIGLTKEQLNTLTLARLDATIAIEEGNLALQRSTGGIEDETAALEKKIAVLKETRELTAQGQIKQAAVDTRADQDKASKEFADTLHNDLKSAFSAAFRDTKDPLTAFGNALSDVIYSRASTALIEALTDKAFNSLFSGSGDALSSFVGALFGGAPGKAVGGPVSAGGLYQVNERGPELLNVGNKQFLMMGGKNGTITPNGGQSGAGAGNTVVVNVNQSFAPGTSRATTLQAASDARRQLEFAGRNL